MRLQGLSSRPRIVLLTLAIAGWASHVGASERDGICAQLRVFEAAPFKLGGDGKPVRRWVAFEWKGHFPGEYEDICHHSADMAEKALCGYLILNTNQEFRAELPIRVLRCYGYAFPQFAQYDWAVSKAQFRLRGRMDDRRFLLNVESFPGEGADSAVWVSAVPENASKDDRDPPPLGGR